MRMHLEHSHLRERSFALLESREIHWTPFCKSGQLADELTRHKLFVVNGEISGKKVVRVDFSV